MPPESVAVSLHVFQNDIDAGMNAPDVVINVMVPAMTVVGDKFHDGEIYIPEMIIAAKTMAETLDYFKEQLTGAKIQEAGTVVIGTVKGDLHDIGKNLVKMMLEGQGFSVEDIGISVSEDQFVDAVKQKKPDILALSALLTTTIPEMKTVIKVNSINQLLHLYMHRLPGLNLCYPRRHHV